MKTRILGKLKIAGWTIGLLSCMASCSGLLDEQPRDSYTPEFFTTAKGVEGGITSLYAHLRYIYGQGYYYNACETGTDEVTYAQSADGNFKDADLSGVGNLDASSSRSDVICHLLILIRQMLFLRMGQKLEWKNLCLLKHISSVLSIILI